MALKYHIEYYDTVNTLHRFELYDDDFVGDSTQVQGSAVLDYGQVDENLEAIRGQGLRVSLEASETLTFEDLFTDNERVIRVVYKRDSVTLFEGWLNPQGFYEDFVNDRWVVSFDCIDGLSYLKNFAFVDSSGLNIVGIRTQLELLAIALKRTGLEKNINVSIGVSYDGGGYDSLLSVLENVKANPRRYIKDDNNTVMSCEEVIRDILEPYGAVLTTYQGEWLIYKPNQLFLDSEQTFYRYDYEGAALSPTTKDIDFAFSIGSNINDFYPHYCNENQQITNKPSFGAYRINYKYGLIRTLIENSFLYTSNGLRYDNFEILNSGFVDVPSAGGYGTRLRAFSTFLGDKDYIFKSNRIAITDQTAIDLTIKSTMTIDPGGDTAWSSPNLLVGVWIVALGEDPENASTEKYFYNGASWVDKTGDSVLDFQEESFSSSQVLNIETTSVFSVSTPPIEGDIHFYFNHPQVNFGVNPSQPVGVYLDFREISAENTNDPINSDVKGETFTFQRTINPSSNTAKTKEVFTGDSFFDIYEGSLYKNDGITPTETWARDGITESVSILVIMGGEMMRMNASTVRIFSGDIYGFFDYMSVVSIDGKSGLYGVTKYSYDTKQNIISVELTQLYGDELLDLTFEEDLDYGKVVEPTIKG